MSTDPGPHEIPVPRMTEDELREFVLGFCDDKIFSAAHLPPRERGNLMSMVFMPLAFGALAEMPEKDIAQIGMLWEWVAKALPRMVNGYPIFGSVRLMHVDDWERALKAIRKEQDRRKEVPV